MGYSEDITAALAHAKKAAPRAKVGHAALHAEAVRAAVWLARKGHDDRQEHGARLAWYLACYRLGHGAADKGLCLSGPCGTGKTVALQLLAQYVGSCYMTATEAVERYRADVDGWAEMV